MVLPNHLGDVVMATPALRALREALPEAAITALVREELVGVLRGTPWVDRLQGHALYGFRGPSQWLRRATLARRSLRGADAVVVLPNSVSSAFLAWCSGARRRIGYGRSGRSPLLTEAVPPARRNGRFQPVAMERYYLDLVRQLAGEAGDTPAFGDTRLELPLDPDSERACAGLLRQHGISPDEDLVCIAPGAAYGPSKLWPLAYYAEVASSLLGEGARVALVHAPGEQALADEILARSAPGVVSLGGGGMTLSLLKSVVARAKLVICNDAGARHIAAAFSVPALVLMGPTSVQYTNLNLRTTKLLRHPVHCSPCQRKVCPIDHRCMTRLLPERVLREARSALRDPDWRGSVELELGAQGPV